MLVWLCVEDGGWSCLEKGIEVEGEMMNGRPKMTQKKHVEEESRKPVLSRCGALC